MMALKGKAERAVISDKFNPRIIKYMYMFACVLDTLEPLISRTIKCGSEPRGRSCGGKVRMQGDPQLTELSALQCFSLRRHASFLHRVGSASALNCKEAH